MPSCLRLFVHCDRRAASRAAWTAGKSNTIKTAMIAITTNSSIKVKARRRVMGRSRKSRKEAATRARPSNITNRKLIIPEASPSKRDEYEESDPEDAGMKVEG